MEIVKDPSPKFLTVEKSAMPFNIASSTVNLELMVHELENQNKELKRQTERLMQINRKMNLFKSQGEYQFDVRMIPCFKCDNSILGV